MQQFPPAGTPQFGEREQCRRDRSHWMDHGAEMSVVEFEDIGADRVKKRGM